MLTDIVRAVLAEEGSSVSTEEVTAEVIRRIPVNDLRDALAEALPGVVIRERGQRNKLLFRPVDSYSPSPSSAPRSASLTPGGARTASARSALLMGDQLLQMTITGHGNRAVRLGQARLVDLRMEIDVNRSKGHTLTRRADIFDEMLHEMASLQVEAVPQLPAESRDKYWQRLAELYG